MIDLSKYEYVFMSEKDSHGDTHKMHNAGGVKIKKDDISVAFIGFSHGTQNNKITSSNYSLDFKMRNGVNVSIPRESVVLKDDNQPQRNKIIAELKKELRELLGE